MTKTNETQLVLLPLFAKFSVCHDIKPEYPKTLEYEEEK